MQNGAGIVRRRFFAVETVTVRIQMRSYSVKDRIPKKLRDQKQVKAPSMMKSAPVVNVLVSPAR